MTTVRIRIKSKLTVEVSVKGHADYSPGNDIVCAGISTLSYTLLNYIRQAEKEHLVSDYSYTEEPGDIHMEFKVQWLFGREIGTAIDVFRTGMERLESQYPENIRVEVEP